MIERENAREKEWYRERIKERKNEKEKEWMRERMKEKEW